MAKKRARFNIHMLYLLDQPQSEDEVNGECASVCYDCQNCECKCRCSKKVVDNQKGIS